PYQQGCQSISNRNQYESHSYHHSETPLHRNHRHSETSSH
ncbi:15691_t:CDS:1, partial [Racocetra persica]